MLRPFPEDPGEGGNASAGRACRLLLAGEGDQGQQAVAGAALKLLGSCGAAAGGPCVVSLPALVVAGGGDASSGCVSLLRDALHRCVCPLPACAATASTTC